MQAALKHRRNTTAPGSTTIAETKHDHDDETGLHQAVDEQRYSNQTLRSRIQRNSLYLQQLEREICAARGVVDTQRDGDPDDDTKDTTSTLMTLTQRKKLLEDAVGKLQQVEEKLKPYVQSEPRDQLQSANANDPDQAYRLPNSWHKATDYNHSQDYHRAAIQGEHSQKLKPQEKSLRQLDSGFLEEERPAKTARKSTLYSQGRKPPRGTRPSRRRKLYK